MSLGFRIAGQVALGVVVAGLAHAGWLAALWLVQPDLSSVSWWLPVGSQAGLTFAVAAALAWAVQRELLPLRRTLRAMQDQLEALQQGRFVLGDVPAVPELGPLAHSLNDTVRRFRSIAQSTPAQPVQTWLGQTAGDQVTGLDGRNAFLRKLIERLADASAPPCALVVLRLLTQSSDSDNSPGLFGEGTVGDVLRVYADRVPGAFGGRLGQVDFALCLPAHGVAEDTARSVLAALKATVLGRNCALAALDDLGGARLGQVLAQIDSALGCAEGAGQGNIEVRSGPDVTPLSSADATLCAQIVDALRHDRISLAEFPVVDADGRLLHLECPMRLRLDAAGADAPARQWLAVASRNHLMTQIDLAAVELALQAIARDSTPRCVHVSAESLATAGFVTAVAGRLEGAPDPATRLWIEISEVSFERLPPRLRNAGTAWRLCGARVGIEHAGAELRSLVRVGELELDYVKVDRAFVQGLADDDQQRERALGLVAFVHELGARVIAEGISDESDLPALWRLGFDGATGQAVTRLQSLVQATSPA